MCLVQHKYSHIPFHTHKTNLSVTAGLSQQHRLLINSLRALQPFASVDRRGDNIHSLTMRILSPILG